MHSETGKLLSVVNKDVPSLKPFQDPSRLRRAWKKASLALPRQTCNSSPTPPQERLSIPPAFGIPEASLKPFHVPSELRIAWNNFPSLCRQICNSLATPCAGHHRVVATRIRYGGHVVETIPRAIRVADRVKDSPVVLVEANVQFAGDSCGRTPSRCRYPHSGTVDTSLKPFHVPSELRIA